jgi:hypothetical protein
VKLRTADGRWQVELVVIDGNERLRVRDHGYFAGYTRSLDELAALGVPVTDLEEEKCGSAGTARP